MDWVKRLKELGLVGTVCTLVLVLIIAIKLAPALSDLQTTYRAKEITDNTDEKDVSQTAKEIADLTADTAEGEVWSALLAPIIAFVVSGLTALYLFLRKYAPS